MFIQKDHQIRRENAQKITKFYANKNQSFKAIIHGGSLSISNQESYHYALSREMTQGA